MSSYAKVSTDRILQDLRLRARHGAVVQGLGCACSSCRSSVGAFWDGWSYQGAVDRLEAYATATQQAIARVSAGTIDMTKANIQKWAEGARDLASSAVLHGATTLADAGKVVADRIAASVEALGKGAGAAWEAFFGVKPVQGFLLSAGVALLAAAGAGWLLLTPGGQALLMGGGQLAAGGGKALWRLA